MIHVEYWIAFDGTKFADEYECRDYEHDIKFKELGIEFFNIDHEPCTPDEAWFVNLTKNITPEIDDEICDIYGCCSNPIYKGKWELEVKTFCYFPDKKDGVVYYQKDGETSERWKKIGD